MVFRLYRSENENNGLGPWVGIKRVEIRQAMMDCRGLEKETMKKYKIIYADPPWRFSNKKTGGGKMVSGSASKYPVMSVDDICRLPVKEICDEDCILFIWWVAAQPAEVMRIISAWGFKLKTMTGFDWTKETKTGKDFFGMGFWTRQGSEHCAIGLKGKIVRKSKSVRACLRACAGRHSAKPAEVLARIIELCGALPRIELFARSESPGWDSWGNEVSEKSLLEYVTSESTFLSNR